ncbi:MAG: glycosyltransferase [Candidatus Woesearchaeota archaeon]|nr:glycosyltransferase [Candidatus Woesearchaeota archaeon]
MPLDNMLDLSDLDFLPSNLGGTAVIISAYNEETEDFEKTLKIVNTALELQLISAVIVIDDGSRDNTFYMAQVQQSESLSSNFYIIRHPQNMGKTETFLSGLRYAQRLSAEYVLTLDADFWYLHESMLAEIVDPLKHENYDMSITSCHSGIHFRTEHAQSGFRAMTMASLAPFFDPDFSYRPSLELLFSTPADENGPFTYLLEYQLNAFFEAHSKKIYHCTNIDAWTRDAGRGEEKIYERIRQNLGIAKDMGQRYSDAIATDKIF